MSSAHVLPMGVFLAFLALTSMIKAPPGPWWRATPEFWIYPVQTIVCAVLLLAFRHRYNFGSVRAIAVVVGVAAATFVLWIAPQQWLHFAPRLDGFNPDRLAANPAVYWMTIAFRFLRLVVVVPIVEEIFWRGFLLRYLIKEKFTDVPVGAFTWMSFTVVTVAFALSHAVPDWPAAVVTGALYNFVAYRSRSLTACILTHAITNLLLGLWIMTTKQWGFW